MELIDDDKLRIFGGTLHGPPELARRPREWLLVDPQNDLEIDSRTVREGLRPRGAGLRACGISAGPPAAAGAAARPHWPARVVVAPAAEPPLAQLLGAGGFGRTLKATFKRGGGSTGAYVHEEVAVKMLFCSTKLPEELLHSFHMDAYFLAQLSHRNVLRLYGACIRQPHLCLVQELAELGRRGPARRNTSSAHRGRP